MDRWAHVGGLRHSDFAGRVWGSVCKTGKLCGTTRKEPSKEIALLVPLCAVYIVIESLKGGKQPLVSVGVDSENAAKV